ncbi:MAG: RNA polymerase sigma factor [Mogibacterium sp.]|nr:RNA polymerase sigma factor [Mogibacterium sp.]
MTDRIETDNILYGRFLSGETSAFDELMIRHGDSVTLYLYGYLHDWHDAEDLMIEAFARIMVKRPSMHSGAFKAYLLKTARNLALRHHERRTRIQSFSIDGMEQEVADSILASGAPASDYIKDEEQRRILQACLDRIEPELREALWLVYYEGMSYEQTAAAMGIKVKRVDRLLARGKQQMRAELEKEGIWHT